MKDKLEQKIRELVPSLMKLSFGCEVMAHGYSATLLEWEDDDGFIVMNEFGLSNRFYVRKDEVQEIIGHPIHLEHVLWSVGEEVANNRLKIDVNGNGLYFTKGGDAVFYEFNKPFTEQPPELYKFLSDILIDE